MGFVNSKHLGLDPKDSMEPPETLKAGQGTGFCVHAKMLAADGSVDDTLTLILESRSGMQMGQREEPDGDQARKDSSGDGENVRV